MVDFYTKEDFLNEVEIDEDLDALPSEETLERTVENVCKRNIAVTVCESPDEAREYLVSLLPQGASVMHGHSTTLHELGFIEYLDQMEDIEYLSEEIKQTDDDAKRQELRREAVAADVFFDAPNAIAATGEIVAANGKGTSLGAWPYPAGRLVLVSGTNKIVPTLDDAINRVRNVAYPLEDARVKATEGGESVVGKLLTYEYEKQDNRTELVLLDGDYGF